MIIVSSSFYLSLTPLYLWDLNTGQCIKLITNCHQGSVQCLTKLGTHTFCSGGNDGYLCIWKNNGDFIDKIKRQEEESMSLPKPCIHWMTYFDFYIDLNCLLVLPGDRIVTGSNSALLCMFIECDTSDIKARLLISFFCKNDKLSIAWPQDDALNCYPIIEIQSGV